MGLIQIALVALGAIGAVTARVAQPVAAADTTLNADYNNTFTAELVKRAPLAPNTALCKIYKIDNSRYYTVNIGVPPPADPECRDLIQEMMVYVLINAGSGFACARTEGDQTTLQFETPKHVFPTVPFWHEGICHTGEYPRPNYWTGDPHNAKRALEYGLEGDEEQFFTDSELA
ncbi:hypothetical protein BST61_g6346 [Cercospora zeina]